MSDKDFKVKNKLQVKGITSAGPLVSDASGNLDSTPYIATQYGGTGTSTSPTAGQVLYSPSGTTYTATTFSSLPGVYARGNTASRPVSPTAGDLYYNTELNYFESYTSNGWFPIAAAPLAPTGVTATNQPSGRAYNNGQMSVAFTPNTSGGAPTSFVVTPSPSTSPTTFTGSSSPVIVTGLSSSTQYTYTVQSTSPYGTSSASSASSGVTATTVPQAPTIGTFTDGGTGTSGTLSFTAGATGGSAITNYKYSTDGTTYTAFSPAQTTSPLTIANLTPASYTFYLKSVNANGDSTASSGASGTVLTPPAGAYYSLASTTLSSSASSITISNIDQTYQHLIVRVCAYPVVSGGTESNYGIRFNSDSGTNYNYNLSVGDGSSQAALYTQNDTALNWGYTYGTYAWSNPAPVVAQFLIPNYAGTSNYKSTIEYEGVTGTSVGGAQSLGAVWKSTAAITSITMLSTNGLALNTNSYLAIYGIKGS